MTNNDDLSCMPKSVRSPIRDPYTHAEWDTAITLVRLRTRDPTQAITANKAATENVPPPTTKKPTAATIFTSMRGDTDYPLKLTRSPEISYIVATAKGHHTDTLTSAPQRRVTRSMGTKTAKIAAYDMSYHPLDEYIGTHARSGRKKK